MDTKPPEEKPAALPVKAIEESRMVAAAFVRSDPMHVTLPGMDTIEEGVQDVALWQNVGPRLCMHQWIEITNDVGSFWRLMRVERIHGSPGTGLRALTLRDLVPPHEIDAASVTIVPTGQWEIRWGGIHNKWQVVSPAGVVSKHGFNTEAEARTHRNLEERNPKPR
jgi:hypothetical protein